MSNSFAAITAEALLPCSADTFARLKKMLETGPHGFEVSYRDKGIFIFAQFSGFPDELPAEFLAEVARLIAASKRQYLFLGEAVYSDTLRPGSHGGGGFRIMRSGKLIHGTLVFEEE